MKGLLGILVAIAIGVGGWFVLTQVDDGRTEDDSATKGPLDPADESTDGDKTPPVGPAKPVAVPQDKEDRQALWRKLRPVVEQLVPDPDKVGPCPPTAMGGLARPVVRQFIDHANGCPTWIHDDGNRTLLHPASKGRKPNGEVYDIHESVSTVVRTEAKPILPGEGMPPAKSGSKDKAPSK